MKKATTAITLMLLLGLAVTPAAWAGRDTFIKSDDYNEDDEVVGKFLKDDDYRIMVNDIERNGEDFDWGWAKTSGKADRPKKLDFDLASYKSVSIAKVQNLAGVIPRELPDETRDAFAQALESLGLTISEKGALELSMAIVDCKEDSTYVYFAHIDPFVEIELRLKVKATGENLVLIRNQVHGSNVGYAAENMASEFAKFMR